VISAASIAEPTRYIASGVVCALVNNIILIGSHQLGLGYFGILAMSWAIGGSIGYALHSRLTFRAAASMIGYVRFMTNVAMGVPLAFILLWLLLSALLWPMWAAAPASTILMFFFNYLGARIAILRRLPWSAQERPL
jgi:putative flippase GtrA